MNGHVGVPAGCFTALDFTLIILNGASSYPQSTILQPTLIEHEEEQYNISSDGYVCLYVFDKNSLSHIFTDVLEEQNKNNSNNLVELGAGFINFSWYTKLHPTTLIYLNYLQMMATFFATVFHLKLSVNITL